MKEEDPSLCPSCGHYFPLEQTVWYVPYRNTFACSEKCARRLHGQKVDTSE